MSAPVFHNNVPKAYRDLADTVRDSGMSPAECAAEISDDARDQFSYYRYFTLAKEFADAGAPSYVLSHSIAAALTATRAPILPFAHCPYPAFFIEVPSEFLPLPDHPNRIDTPKRWISVVATEALRAVSVHAKGICSVLYMQAQGTYRNVLFREEGLRDLSSPAARDVLFEMRLAIRLASNVVAYVTTHREAVTVRAGSRSSPSDVRLLDVGAPHDVVIDRAFRDQVRDLVASRTVPRARGVLAHLVRGHWRSVPAKESLLWIAPYRRGDDNIGRVVERTERL